MEITAGIEAASAVLQRTNEAVHREEREAAVAELNERVEDWKGHRLSNFGELLLYGTHQVIKNGASGGKDEEREVRASHFWHSNGSLRLTF
jgi:cell division control protein 24